MDVEKSKWLKTMGEMRRKSAGDYLGIDVVEFEDDGIVLRMPITDKTRQPMGLLHGGINMLLAETAASLHACWGIDLSKVNPVGVDINGTHLRSAREGTVRAEGRVIRRTRSFIFHQVDMYLEESGDQLAAARVTNYYKSISNQEN